MKVPNFSSLFQVGKSVLMTNRPEMLLGAAVAATIGSVVLAARGGYKSGLAVAEANAERAYSEQPEMSTPEIVALTWQNYLPAAGVAVTALASTCGLHIVHVKEKKQIVAAGLAAVEEAKKSYEEYIKDLNEAVAENATTKTHEKIQNALMEKSAERSPDGVAHILSSDGIVNDYYVVRDARTGRDVWSHKNIIEEAMIEIRKIMSGQGDVDLNTFYSFANINLIPDGEEWGWSGKLPELIWTVNVRDDGTPVKEFSFRPEPRQGYDSKASESG